jgi:hypothetical protein
MRNVEHMVFALDTDDGGLLAFETAAEAVGHCKGIDVKDGYWLFFDDDGSPLEARFGHGNQVKDTGLNYGVYILERPMSGLWLQERLAQVVRLEGCGLGTIAELVEILKVNRSKRVARGGNRG